MNETIKMKYINNIDIIYRYMELFLLFITCVMIYLNIKFILINIAIAIFVMIIYMLYMMYNYMCEYYI